MDKFNLHNYYRNFYIKEAMGDDDSIRDQIKDLNKEYQKEVEQLFPNYNVHVSMGFYCTDRPDTDKYKGKGYGDIHFIKRDEIPENDWKKALDLVKKWGFEITSESNWYEMEWDGDRAWYPKIKFEFLAQDKLL